MQWALRRYEGYVSDLQLKDEDGKGQGKLSGSLGYTSASRVCKTDAQIINSFVLFFLTYFLGQDSPTY